MIGKLLLQNNHGTSIVITLLLPPAFSVAQSAADALSVSGSTGTSFAATMMPTTLSTTTFSVQNSTTSSKIPSKTPNTPQDLIPGFSNPKSDPASDSPSRRDGVINYYFFFIAIFGVVVAILLWWIQKGRKQRKEQMRMSSQNALARDMEGWVNTRRWFHGNWRPNQTAAFIRREEGLNEQGEAPPPYQPHTDSPVPQDPGAMDGLAIPLRAVSRQDREQGRLPGYRESVNGEDVVNNPNAADSPHSRTTSENAQAQISARAFSPPHPP